MLRPSNYSPRCFGFKGQLCFHLCAVTQRDLGRMYGRMPPYYVTKRFVLYNAPLHHVKARTVPLVCNVQIRISLSDGIPRLSGAQQSLIFLVKNSLTYNWSFSPVATSANLKAPMVQWLGFLPSMIDSKRSAFDSRLAQFSFASSTVIKDLFGCAHASSSFWDVCIFMLPWVVNS